MNIGNFLSFVKEPFPELVKNETLNENISTKKPQTSDHPLSGWRVEVAVDDEWNHTPLTYYMRM